MSWKVRHQGSPKALEGLALPQVVEGLQDGLWDPTDEVMGDEETEWTAIENHPALAEVAADLEPLPAKSHEDETRLDMNPLIDVALVLLIFFILTTSYAALQKVLEMPGTTAKDGTHRPPAVTPEQVSEFMIRVSARMEGGKPLIKVEDEVVPRENLGEQLTRLARLNPRKAYLLMDVQDVDMQTVVDIQDAAKEAGLQKIKNVSHRPGAS